MTYKSTKFHQSPVARSLEQLAIQKGLFKPQSEEKAPVVKIAAVQKAPKSFPERLLKLCDGLRSQGFVSYANQLETQFLLMKKAESNLRSELIKQGSDEQVHLYNTHNEEGKDIIEFAHPEKNKKLDKSWDDLGVIENIVERHDKILNVVNKRPKGKLASKNIVNAVKIVLSQDGGSSDHSGKIKEIVAEGLNYVRDIINELLQRNQHLYKTEGKVILPQGLLEDIRDDFSEANKMADKELDYNTIMEVTKKIDGLIGVIFATSKMTSENSFFVTEDGQALLERIKSFWETAKSRFNAAFELLKGQVQGAQFQLEQGIEPSKISLDGEGHPAAKSSETPNAAASDFEKYTKHYLNVVQQWKTAIDNDAENTPEDKQKANAFLDAKAQQFTSLLQEFETAPPGSAPAFTKQLHDLAASLDKFRKEWIG